MELHFVSHLITHHTAHLPNKFQSKRSIKTIQENFETPQSLILLILPQRFLNHFPLSSASKRMNERSSVGSTARIAVSRTGSSFGS